MVLPSLYTWYNVIAFWNPYEATGNLEVCVVNQDAGTDNELVGELNVGNRVEEELLANDKLHFVAKDLDTALEDLKAGRVYAAYVLPEDFSECLVSPVTGDVKSPKITYYTNEKLGPVSPKITDTAANTLDQTINSMFVSTVSEAAVKAIDEAANDAEADVTAAQSKATKRMNKAAKAIANVRKDLADIQKTCIDAKDKALSASASMDDATTLTADARAVLADISKEASAAQDSLSSVASDSVGSLSDILVDVSQVTSKASTAADGFVSKAGAAESRVNLATSRIQPVITALADIADDLNDLANALSDESAAKAKIAASAQTIADHRARLQTLLDDANALGERISGASQTASDTATALEESAQQASETLQEYSDDLYGSAAPAINSSIAQISTACERLASATLNLDTTIQQAKASLNQLGGLLGDCGDAVAQTDELIGGFQDDLDSILTDVSVLAQSGAVADILNSGTLNSQSISSFMAAPTKLNKEALYSPNAYGTAMAPLFMNLTFWIGAFMLVIIGRLEVDDEGVKRLTPGQRYLARFLEFSSIAIVQAIICCAGVLVLGVQAANIPALFIAAVVAALAYNSIIYALSSTLRHIGQALCIILVFAQIPGGSGLYPLELTDKFFQTIYPFLPFSYGIGALREAICGFYDGYYVHDLAMLAVMLVCALALGMLLSPVMSNVIRMASRQILEGDLYNGEEAVIPERPSYLLKLLGALTDREDFRDSIEQRYDRFNKRYPTIIHASIILGIGVPLALALLLALDAAEKVTLLTLVVLWLSCLTVFLIVMESKRYNFERELNVGNMSDEHLFKEIFGRSLIGTAPADARVERADSPEGDREAPQGEKPAEDAIEPSQDGGEPAEDASNRGTHASDDEVPAQDGDEPAEDAIEPVEDGSEPAEDASNRGTHASDDEAPAEHTAAKPKHAKREASEEGPLPDDADEAEEADHA